MSSTVSRPFAGALLGAAMILMPAAAFAEDKVIAKVNGKAITEAELAFAESEIGVDLSSMPLEAKKRLLAEFLIETELFAAAAEADKMAEGPDFEKRLAFARQRALRQAYFDKAVKGAIGEGALKGFYEDKVKEIKPQDEVQARHILVASEDQAKAIADKIAKGDDFAALAKENSVDAGSKADGGMLGYFGRGQMVPQFEEAAFAMQKGEISKPVRSQYGWHIIKVEDRRQKPPPTFEQVRGQILGAMMKSQGQTVFEGLKSKAQIEYVDPEVKRIVETEAKQKAEFDAQMKEQLDKMQAPEKK